MKSSTLRESAHIISLAILLLLSSNGWSHDESRREVVSGARVHQIKSSCTGITRTIRVVLPRTYNERSGRYPLILLLDGDEYLAYLRGLTDLLQTAGTLPPVIIATVNSPDRWHDFTPTRAGIPGADKMPTSGGGKAFLEFLVHDALPVLDASYRTVPFRIIVGHSLAGLFSTYAFVNGQGRFQACIASSPSLWWDEGKLIGEFLENAPENGGPVTHFFYSAVGGEGETLEKPWTKLRDGLRAEPPRHVRFLFRRFPGRKHQAMPAMSFIDGLEFIFAAWAPTADLPEKGLPGVRDFYARVSSLYGFRVKPPEFMVNRMGYRELRRGRLDAALEWFRFNASLYPESANVHDSLGDALSAAGKNKAALLRYRRALDMDPRMPGLEQRILKLEQEITTGKE